MNDVKHDREIQAGLRQQKRHPWSGCRWKGRIGKAGIAGLEEGAERLRVLGGKPTICSVPECLEHRRGKAEGDERVMVANWGP